MGRRGGRGGGGGWWAERDERSKRATKNFSAGAISDPHPFYFFSLLLFGPRPRNSIGRIANVCLRRRVLQQMGPCSLRKEMLQSHLVQGKEGERKIELVYKKRKRAKQKSAWWDGVQVEGDPAKDSTFHPSTFLGRSAGSLLLDLLDLLLELLPHLHHPAVVADRLALEQGLDESVKVGVDCEAKPRTCQFGVASRDSDLPDAPLGSGLARRTWSKYAGSCKRTYEESQLLTPRGSLGVRHAPS